MPTIRQVHITTVTQVQNGNPVTLVDSTKPTAVNNAIGGTDIIVNVTYNSDANTALILTFHETREITNAATVNVRHPRGERLSRKRVRVAGVAQPAAAPVAVPQITIPGKDVPNDKDVVYIICVAELNGWAAASVNISVGP
jgi:hypothetical protein